jgi:hypothetical protein
MSSILSIPGAAASAPASQTAATTQAAPTTPQQLTEVQMLEEPLFELMQQAEAGDPLAIQLLAQEQAATHTLQAPGTKAGSTPIYGTINLLA